MLCLVTALPSEARPLLGHFSLTGQRLPGPFDLYLHDGVALIVSGIGKAAVAAACGYLYATLEHRPGVSDSALASAIWINVGIAGHGELPLGEALLVHEVRDQASGVRHFPPLLFDPPCATGTVITVDRVERHYDPPVAYDMEASAFFGATRRLASSELVHALKVVSDGPGDAPEAISRDRVEGWIQGHVKTLDALIDRCRGLAAEIEPLHREPPEFEACLDRWHFTTSDRRELRRLLRRRLTLVPEVPLPVEDLPETTRGRQVNRVLTAWLDGLDVVY